MRVRLDAPGSDYIQNFMPENVDYDENPETYHKIFLKLIKSGADVNLRTNSGLSPLMASVLLNDLEKVKILLERGANPYLKFNGLTPYDQALETKKPQMIDLLSKAMNK